MNEKQAHKQAAKSSKTDGQQFVVYVFDQGYDVYDAEQCRRYAPLIVVEAAYLGGVQIAANAAVA